MKRQITFTLIALSCFAMLLGGLSFSDSGRNLRASLVPTAHAQEQEAVAGREQRAEFPRRPSCTLGTIQGSYGFIAQGTIVPGAPLPGIPAGVYATQGVITLDGFGNSTGLTNDSFNGNVVPTTMYTGKYVVSDNCLGTLTITGGAPFNFTIVEGGKEILFMVGAPGTAITGVAKRL